MGKAAGAANNPVTNNNKNNPKMGSPNLAPNTQMQNLHIPANWRSDLGWLQIFNNTGSFSNIAAGDRVIVRADASNLAKQIMIIKAPVNRTLKGNIVLIDPTHITVTPAGAAAITLNVTATTQIILKGRTSISGYASALYNSSNNNALVVNVQANAPTPAPVAAIPPSVTP